MRNALVISGIAHALFWGLNALHGPKPLASDAATPIAVEIVSPDEIERWPKSEKTETEKAEKREASPTEKAQSQPSLPQQSQDQTFQGRQAQHPPAEQSTAASAPKIAQAEWKPQQFAPSGSWLDSALGSPPITANAFDSIETVARLSQQEIAMLKARLKECWNPPAGLSETKNLLVMLRVALAPDGALRAEPTMIAASASAEGPILVQTAKRALQQCQPFNFLPSAKYNEWKVLDLNFAPTGLSTTRIAPVL